MAARESVTFDFIGRGAGPLADDFKKTGEGATLAAKGARLLADSLEKQRRATDVAAGASLALAKADKILADAEHHLADGALEAEFALKKQAEQAKQTAAETAAAGAAAGEARTGFGGLSPAIAAAAGAGLALSPVIVTLGAGLGGLGLAAAGTVGPVLKAAQSAKGLQAAWAKLDPEQRAAARSLLVLKGEYSAFENALQPEVLGVFSAAVRLGGHVLADIQPVAIATGKSLGMFIGQIDATLNDPQWRGFWQFMGDTAPHDVALLGTSLNNLAKAAPAFLESMQSDASGILLLASALTKVISLGGPLLKAQKDQEDQLRHGHSAWDTLAGDSLHVFQLMNPLIAVSSFFADKTRGVGDAARSAAPQLRQLSDGAGAFQDNVSQLIHPLATAQASFGQLVHPIGETADGLGVLARVSPVASKGIFATAAAAAATTVHVRAMKQSVQELTDAESKSLDTQLAYSNALLTSRNDAVSLRQALKASHDQIGMNTAAQRASFGAANTYISDLEQAAKQAIASGHGASGAASAIRAGLPILDAAKTKNRLYWQEVRTLKDWLDKLRAERTIQERITVTGQGTWTMHNPSNQSLPGGFPGGTGAAAGAYITQGTTATADDVLARVSKGELIVPTKFVNSGAVDHLRGQIPGFATGGIAGSYSGSVAGLKPWAAGNVAATNSIVLNSLGNAIAHAFTSALSSFADSGARSGSALLAQNYARSLLPAYGWGMGQWPSLLSLWNRESGWNAYAVNPSSGAYGIPQSLGHGHPYNLGDYKAQDQWGLSYIAQRYGSPAAAWGHELNFGWYDRGGWLKPGLTLAMNGTGRPEPVGGQAVNVNITVNAAPGLNRRALARDLADLILEHTKVGGRLYPVGVAPK